MLGPTPLGTTELRPKGRGRPQRILLGQVRGLLLLLLLLLLPVQWPEEHVRQVIRAVVFRESSSLSTPPAPSPSPYQDPEAGGLVPKQEVGAGAPHPLAAEALAAQATFEAQMKSFYSNPLACQLLAASSKMLTGFDVNPFLQTVVKQVRLWWWGLVTSPAPGGGGGELPGRGGGGQEGGKGRE